MGILSRIAAASAALALPASLLAQEAAPSPGDAKARDIRRLLEVTGAAKLGLQIADSLLESQKKALPMVPESFWQEFRASLKPEDFAELAVPIYDKHLTHEEIRGLLAFYQGPLGSRLLQVQPLILQDSIAAGRRWGEDLAKKVLEKLRDKGYGPTGVS